MSSFLIQNRFSATLSPRCNPRAADLRILLRITLKYLKIVSKICNSPKNIEAGFSRERPPARPHNGPNGPGPNRSVGRAASNSIRMYRSSAAARFHSHEAKRTVWGGETGRDGRSRDPPPRGRGPLGPLGGRSLENPTSIFFCELQNLLTIFKYSNVIHHRIRRSAALGLHLGESAAEKAILDKKRAYFE